MFDAHITAYHIHLAYTGQPDSAGRRYWIVGAAALTALTEWTEHV